MNRDQQRRIELDLKDIVQILKDYQMLDDSEQSEIVKNYMNKIYNNIDDVDPEELALVLTNLLNYNIEQEVK
ncbi:Ca2+-binding EF-hand superfamily protein [Staphylococcus caledonicus]